MHPKSQTFRAISPRIGIGKPGVLNTSTVIIWINDEPFEVDTRDLAEFVEDCGIEVEFPNGTGQ